MWNKDQTSETAPAPASQPADRDLTHNEAAAPKRGSTGPATIGRSIVIKGEVSGDEDLLIQGRVEGSVDLEQHTVTVGPEGHVKAGITGRLVTVEGRVEGDLRALEQVVLRKSAKVQGDIIAPRVVLEDGAAFRGGVDMGEPFESEPDRSKASEPAARSSASAPTPATTSSNGQGQETAKSAETEVSPEKSSGKRTKETTVLAG